MRCLIFLFISIPVFAGVEKSVYERYSTASNMTDTVKITWETVDNVQKACSEDRIKSIGKPYPYKVLACSNWTKNLFNQYKCHIITGKTVNNEIVGHEIRHCFQGSFHKQ